MYWNWAVQKTCRRLDSKSSRQAREGHGRGRMLFVNFRLSNEAVNVVKWCDMPVEMVSRMGLPSGRNCPGKVICRDNWSWMFFYESCIRQSSHIKSQWSWLLKVMWCSSTALPGQVGRSHAACFAVGPLVMIPWSDVLHCYISFEMLSHNCLLYPVESVDFIKYTTFQDQASRCVQEQSKYPAQVSFTASQDHKMRYCKQLLRCALLPLIGPIHALDLWCFDYNT